MQRALNGLWHWRWPYRRFGVALHLQAYGALNGSPGTRAYYYDAIRARGTGHHAALRQVANRLVGILHGCLESGIPLRRNRCLELLSQRHANLNGTRRLTPIDMGCLLILKTQICPWVFV